MFSWLSKFLPFSYIPSKQYMVYYEPGYTVLEDHVSIRNSDLAKELLQNLIDGDSFIIHPPFRVAELKDGQWVEIFGETKNEIQT